MAHPFLSEKNFADGGVAQWDSETDSSSYFNVRSYKWLADRKRPVPYRGAYAAEIDFGIKSTATNAAYVAETGDLDTACAAAGTAYIRFYVYFDSSVTWTMANNDEFTIFGLFATTTEEVGVHVKYTTAAGYQIIATDGAGTATAKLEFDKWLCVELYVLIDSGVGNDGTIDFYLDGNQIESQITSCDQGGITEYRYGVVGPDAGTTSGRIYLGPVVADDGRLYPNPSRYPFNRVLSLTEQVFVGPGWIDSASILSSTSGNAVKLYDTDLGGSTVAENSAVVDLSTDTETTAGSVYFNKGCYAVLSGTNPRVRVVMTEFPLTPGAFGPIHNSERGWRSWATKS